MGAFKKRKAKGLIRWRYGGSGRGGDPTPRRMRGGDGGKHIEVYIDDANLSQSAERPGSQSGAGAALCDKPKKSNTKERYKIHRGEPGCNVVTPFVNGQPQTEILSQAQDDIPTNNIPMSNQNTETLPPVPSLVPPAQDPTAGGGAVVSPSPPSSPSPLKGEGNFLVTSPPRGEGIIEVSSPARGEGIVVTARAARIANLRFALIQAFNEEAAKNHRPKAEIIQHFLDLYNSGVLLPEIHAELKDIKRSTLYNWLALYQSATGQAAEGPQSLTPQYGGAGQSKITDHEKNLILTLLLHQNRLKIAYAITLAKEYLAKKQILSPSSPSTLRRFVDQFKKEHYDIWTLRREGEKALNDKVIPYAERDWHLLEVGDGLVADGHRLNFQIISPDTGKPCRAALVLFWDWKSSYPLGWEIMLEENVQCVASALRNAILTLGKIPKWVLLDNGKAFKAKIFTEDISFEDTELPGMFARLNINYHFAQPYNAQAKPIERIFGILNEQLERLVGSYTGASIEDKPAWTKRNENLARKCHDPDNVPTIPEASQYIRAWRDRYAERPSRGRDGLRPIDIYNDGKGPGADPAELIYLMMDREIKNLHRNGVTWLGWHWYDENMYGLKDKVVIRYSLSDLSQIYVFHKNEFLCAAKPVDQVHPMASESESPKDMEAVKEVIRLKKKVKNTTRKLCDLLDSKPAAQIDWARSRTPEITETIQKVEEAKKPKVVKMSPFLEEAESLKLNAQSEIPQSAIGDPHLGRPWFYDDYEKYDWLMKQPSLSREDKNWLEDFRSRSSLYKNAVSG